MPPTAQTIPLDLAGFTWPELMILVNHLQYAADRLQQEMANLRQDKHYFYPKKARNAHKQQPGLMISHWAGLIRDQRYFSGLARAVKAVLDDQWGTLFISDRPLPPLDLSGLLAKDNRPFFVFLERERHRSHLAVAYLQKETFDELVKRDLLLALDVEIRFFNCLLEWLRPLTPAFLSVPWPEEDRVPLLYVSLPRVLTTGYIRATPQPVGQAA
jgi:hypothetical protein